MSKKKVQWSFMVNMESNDEAKVREIASVGMAAMRLKANELGVDLWDTIDVEEVEL